MTSSGKAHGVLAAVAMLAMTAAGASAAISDPTDLTGLAGWWDASNAGSITHSGGAVSQWNDLSGGAHHLTQATASVQPTTGAFTKNSLNVVRFDGGDQVSRTATVPLAADDDNYTYFVVWQPETASGLQAVYEQGNLVNGQRSSILQQGAAYGFTGHNNDRRVVPLIANQYRVTGLVLDSTDDVATRNLVQYDNGSVYFETINTETGTNNLNIGTGRAIIGANAGGGAEFLQGKVAEMIVYNRSLSLAEREDVTSYLNDKWNVFVNTTPSTGLASLKHRWSFDGNALDSIGTAHGTLFGGASVSGGNLVLDGINDYMRTGVISNSIRERTLVAWVTLDNLTQRSGSVLTIERPAGSSPNDFDGIVYGERTANQWMSGSSFFARSNGANNGGASEATLSEIMMAISYSIDGTISIYREGSLYASYLAPNLLNYEGDDSFVLMGLRHLLAGGGDGTAAGNDKWWAGLINEARIYGSALSAGDIALLYSLGPNQLQPIVIPAPAALPAGLVMLAMLARRRRR